MKKIIKWRKVLPNEKKPGIFCDNCLEKIERGQHYFAISSCHPEPNYADWDVVNRLYHSYCLPINFIGLKKEFEWHINGDY